MVTPTARAVVLVSFPFSDLSRSKLRPAVVLAYAGRNDWEGAVVGKGQKSEGREQKTDVGRKIED